MEHEHTVAPHAQHLAKPKENLSLPVAIVLAGLLIGGAMIYTNKNNPNVQPLNVAKNAAQEEAVDTTQAPIEELKLKPDDHVLGNPNADVLIIEYSDTECPFCKRFHETMAQVMEQSGKTGAVAWVYRYFPLDMHPRARKEAEALECASQIGGNEAFWKYNNRIFAITPANNGLDPAELPKIAEFVGLDVARFTACLDSGKNAGRVQRDFVSGVNVNIHGTPYTIVWNRKTGKQMPINGALPMNNVKAVLSIVMNSQAPTK